MHNQREANDNQILTLYKSTDQEKEKFLHHSESSISRDLNTNSETTVTDSSKDSKAADDVKVSSSAEEDRKHKSDTSMTVLSPSSSIKQPQITVTKHEDEPEEHDQSPQTAGDGVVSGNLHEIYVEKSKPLLEVSQIQYVDTTTDDDDAPLNNQKVLLEAIPELSETNLDRKATSLDINDKAASQHTVLTFEIKPESIRDSKMILKEKLGSVKSDSIDICPEQESSSDILINEPFVVHKVEPERRDSKKLSVQKLPPVTIRNALVLQKLTNVDIPGEKRSQKSTEKCNACYIEIKSDLEEDKDENKQLPDGNQELKTKDAELDLTQQIAFAEQSSQTDKEPCETKETQYTAQQNAAVNTIKSLHDKKNENIQTADKKNDTTSTQTAQKKTPSCQSNQSKKLMALLRLPKSPALSRSSNVDDAVSNVSEDRDAVFASYQVVPARSHDPDFYFDDKHLSNIDDSVYRTFIDPRGLLSSQPSAEKVICLLPERQEFGSTINLMEERQSPIAADLTDATDLLRRHEMYNMHTMGSQIAKNLGQEMGVASISQTKSGNTNMREFDKVITVLNEVIKYTADTSDTEGGSMKKTGTPDKQNKTDNGATGNKKPVKKEEKIPPTDNTFNDDLYSIGFPRRSDSKESELNYLQENTQNVKVGENQEDPPGKVKFIETANVASASEPSSDNDSSIDTKNIVRRRKHANKKQSGDDPDSMLTESTEDIRKKLKKICDKDKEERLRVCCEIFNTEKKSENTVPQMTDRGMQTSSTSDDSVSGSSSSTESHQVSNDSFFKRITSDEKQAMAAEMEKKLAASGSNTSEGNAVAAVLRQEIKEMALKQQESIQQYFVPSPEAIERIQRRSVYFRKKLKEGEKQRSGTDTDESKDEDMTGKALVLKTKKLQLWPLQLYKITLY